MTGRFRAYRGTIRVHVDEVCPPPSAEVLERAARLARGWRSVREAIGVVKGLAADAVADTDALYDEEGE